MTILLISQYFPPVTGAAAKRTGKMARFLDEAGHQVTVLTGFPSYPTGELSKKYRGKLWHKEKDGDINIIRTWELAVSVTDNKIKRLINMISFAKSASIAARHLTKFDVVIVSSPSFLSGQAGLIASRNKKTKFIFDIRDLWPDSAIELGLIKKNGFLAHQAKKIEDRYYKRANKILTATPGIKQHLIDENIDENKITVLLNSVDTNLFKPEKSDLKKLGFSDDDFICGYVGNHSRIYDLETVLKTAQITQKNEKIKYLLIGEGEEKNKLQELAKKMNLANVVFWPEKSLNGLPEIINLFSIGLVPISNLGVSQESFPSKTSEYLACGKPVAASLAGDLAKILKEHEAGLIYAPSDAEALSQIILDLYSNHDKTQKIAQNARNLALEVFSDQTFAEKLIQEFKSIS